MFHIFATEYLVRHRINLKKKHMQKVSHDGHLQEYWPASGKYDKNTATHCIRIVWSKPAFRNAANGSACSQLIGAPHELGRTFSGKLSGTATNMKNTSKTAIAVAKATINVSL